MYVTFDCRIDRFMRKEASCRGFASREEAEIYALAEAERILGPTDAGWILAHLMESGFWAKVPRNWIIDGELAEAGKDFCLKKGVDPRHVIVRESHPDLHDPVGLSIWKEVISAYPAFG